MRLTAASLIRARQRSTASIVFSSFTKEVRSFPAVCRSMRAIFARMSLNETRGSRERKEKILVCARLCLRPETALLDELDPATEKVGKVILDMDDVE